MMTSQDKKTTRTFGRNGFSLVELLAVIAIIAMLAALLLPSLRRVKCQSRIVACLNNLRQWGIGLSVYAGDSRGFLPLPLQGPHYDSPNFYPHICDSSGDPPSTDDLSSHLNPKTMAPYIGGFNESAQRISGVWICPGTKEKQRGTTDFGPWGWYGPNGVGRRLFGLTYIYYGGLDNFSDHAMYPEDLATAKLATWGRRLLMNDLLQSNGGDAFSCMNHDGWRWMPQAVAGPEPIQKMIKSSWNPGLSQLMTDGSAAYRKIKSLPHFRYPVSMSHSPRESCIKDWSGDSGVMVWYYVRPGE